MTPRFDNWQYPEFDENDTTKWNWMCQHHENLELGVNTDIGAFTYINAKFGVKIEEGVEVGSHCSIYSLSTIDNRSGQVVIKMNAKIGTHSVIMPGVTIGKNSIIGAFSFVTSDIPDNVIAHGIPARVQKNLDGTDTDLGD